MGYIPPPPVIPPPTVTADPPLSISGVANKRLVLGGLGGTASFQSIGTDIPILIPQGSALPPVGSQFVGAPFHVVGTPGIKVVSGVDGNNPAQDGFSGAAGTPLAGRPFDDGSGRVWAGNNTVVLDGLGHALNKTGGSNQGRVTVAQPGYVGQGYWASMKIHFEGRPSYQSCIYKLELGTTGGAGGNGLGLYISLQPNAGGNAKGAVSVYENGGGSAAINLVDSVGVVEPYDILIEISCDTAGNFSYSVSGFVDNANTVATFAAGGIGSGIIYVTAWALDVGDGSYFSDFQCGSPGTKHWE